MSTAAAPTLALEIQEYSRTWGACLAAAQQAIPGATCEVLTQVPAATNRDATDLWISATCQRQLGGSVSLRIDRKAASRLSQGVASAVTDSELTDQNKASLLDFIRRAVRDVEERSPQKVKDEFLVDFRDGAPTSTSITVGLQLRGEAADPIVIEVWFDEVVVQRLQSQIGPPSLLQSVEATARSQFGMLIDVELRVTVRFGGRRMLLKDILDLCAGSVVELDQQIQEPVDLLLDDKLIARGEVVVVDGNYGLRVSEVLSGPGR